MKKNKGITLIALIITIIILLILVGVSINLAIKGDLFGSAEKAVNGTNAKTEEEQSRVDELMGELDRVQVHNWKKSGDNISCGHCGVYVKIGQEIKYKDSGSETSVIKASSSGYTSDQTIEKGTDVKWVVFDVSDDNKDGINESLLITTAEPTKTGIIWDEFKLYKNGETELNRVCQELYGSNARSMTIDDINALTGYTPEGAIYSTSKIRDTDMAEETQGVNYIKSEKIGKAKPTLTAIIAKKTYTTGNFTTKLNELDIWDDIKIHSENPEGNSEEVLGNYVLTSYNYEIQNDGQVIEPISGTTQSNISIATRNMLCGTNGCYSYFVASKYVGVDVFTEFKLFGVGNSGRIGSECFSQQHLLGSNGSESTLNRGWIYNSKFEGMQIRPIVALTTNIPEQGDMITQFGDGI